jgi:hypothetical protein
MSGGVVDRENAGFEPERADERCRHGTLWPHRCRDCEAECSCVLCERCHGAGCVMCDGNGATQICAIHRKEGERA